MGRSVLRPYMFQREFGGVSGASSSANDGRDLQVVQKL